MAFLENQNEEPGFISKRVHRRMFMKYAGAAAATSAFLVAGCKDDEEVDKGMPDAEVDLGSGDTGVLNYAYALEQLEAAFYTAVVGEASFASIFNDEEQTVMRDLMAHEITHREFFKAALGTNAIPGLEVDFSSINFADKASVLGAAKTFEDLGVAAYNGAGKLLTDGNLLLVAGKIVSVEARHAAAIRDLIDPKSASFSGDDVVDVNGFDKAIAPADVLSAAATYVKTKINASNLPTS